MQLLIIIILFLEFFVAAQFPTPQVSTPTSWTNNNISLLSISHGTDLPLSSVSSARIILSDKSISAALLQNKTFTSAVTGYAFAFYPAAGYGDGRFFLAVALWSNYKRDNYYYYYYSPTKTWSANRNKPVGENATLELLVDGNLELRDTDGSVVWSTSTSNKSVAGMKMMENGNLVLYDSNNNTIWQSFDHPTDTLLPGQKLVRGKKLVASVSDTNISEGNYYLSMTSQGLFGFYQANNVPQMYFKSLAYGGNVESIELNYDGSKIVLYINAPALGAPWPFINARADNSSGLFLRHDGHLLVYSTSPYNTNDVLTRFLSECDYPTVCRDYELCSNGRCSCLLGIAQDNQTNTQGESRCAEINATTCDNLQHHTLISYENLSHFSYTDDDAAALNGTDIESCKKECLKTCACRVAFFRQRSNSLFGDCFIPSSVLYFIDERDAQNDYKSYAFIKSLDNKENGRGSSRSNVNYKIIAGSIVGAFLLVVLATGFWFVLLRNKGDEEEGMEDNFDNLSGMPMRFTYQALKLATGDFQEKLGQGGFGSVFDGTLQNGDKIAVKRLDAMGQGKKEFLAEVKTIGSIHHVNLVRLIGFCAEKLHRLLIYEFMCNGSLDKWIFCKEPMLRPPLNWQTRRTIILDIAKGLAYLHEECRQRIVHLDIKPQNILLDEELRAKISDFGLCKLIDRDQSQVVTTMRGTPGYVAPELFSLIITEKADVYSFGIVVMEVVCGRKNLDRSQPEDCIHLLPIFMRKAEEGQLMDMVDRSNNMQLYRPEAVQMMKVAIWCLQSDYKRRPSMSVVVKVLEGSLDMETDLDYTIHNPIAATRDAELGTTTPILPSLLSGPR